MTALILGAGVMGSAFAFPLADTGTEVVLVGTHLDDEEIHSVIADHSHPRLPERLPITVRAYHFTDILDALRGEPDLIVLGVSSAGIGWAWQTLARVLRDPVPILLLCKGLVAGEDSVGTLAGEVALRLVHDAGFHHEDVHVGGVGGPCIAGELALRRRTSVVIGANPTMQQLCSECLNAPYYSVHYTTDIAGVELSAALKNFLTLGVAAAKHANHRAALFAQAARELESLVVALGGNSDTVRGLAGLGDLHVTAGHGRNSRLGKLLGDGMSYSKARQELAAETVEGADLGLAVGPAIRSMIAGGELVSADLPITLAILDALENDRALDGRALEV